MSLQPSESGFRLALIGYGTAGRYFHAPLIDSHLGLELAAVVTGNAERAADIAQRYPQTEVLPTVEALWARAQEWDAVVIASPNGMHAPQAEAAIRAGLSVVVDKPLAASVAQAQALVDLARDQGVLLTVFQNRRWDADYLTLASLMAHGRLGSVRRFESRFERWRPQPRPGWKRDADPAAAGGILFDLGSHLIDQALQLFGPVASVYAELEPGYADSRVDDDAFVALTHANGVHSHLWLSSVAALPGPRFRVLGSTAAFEKYGMDPQEACLRAGDRPDQMIWGCEEGAAAGRLGTQDHHELIASIPGDYPAFYRQLAAALRGRQAAPVAPQDSVQVLAIIEAARKASAQGCVISLLSSQGQ